MLNRHTRRLVLAFVPLLGWCAAVGPAAAENIAVGNYGSSANGMPFAVALAKGFFKEEGADVTGIIASEGGGTSVRNAMAGVAYGEANPGAIAVAIQQGADIKIVSDNVLTIAEFAWMVKKDSPIKTIKDLKGKKIGYTNPRSTSQALAILLLQKAGLQAGGRRAREDRRFRADARRARARPDRRGRRSPSRCGPRSRTSIACSITGAEALPPLDNVVGMTTGEAAKTRGDFIRADHPGPAPRRRVHDCASRRSRRHRRQGLQHHTRGGAQRGAQPDDELDAGHSLLGRRAIPSRGHEADHRSAEERRRDYRRYRSCRR